MNSLLRPIRGLNSSEGWQQYWCLMASIVILWIIMKILKSLFLLLKKRETGGGFLFTRRFSDAWWISDHFPNKWPFIFSDELLDKQDQDASFFFIGAEDEKDVPGKATRRFNFYADFVLPVISDRHFMHYRNHLLSLYMLINKDSVKDVETHVRRINRYVTEAMVR